MNEGEEEAGPAIVTRCEATELLEAVEATLDDIALAIDVFVVEPLFSTAWMRRDHRHRAYGVDGVEESAAVITAVGDNVRGAKAFDQRLGLWHVMGLARCDDQAQRTAL